MGTRHAGSSPEAAFRAAACLGPGVVGTRNPTQTADPKKIKLLSSGFWINGRRWRDEECGARNGGQAVKAQPLFSSARHSS
ncbi:MAG TPA: hypothetical protein VFU39_05930, partial [Sulfuricaulis sp.]|nr:hypothetical protein [Sulfuricaulis sp.]